MLWWQAYGVVLGVANEAGTHWDKLAQGICLWEVRTSVIVLAVYYWVKEFVACCHWAWSRQVVGLEVASTIPLGLQPDLNLHQSVKFH